MKRSYTVAGLLVAGVVGLGTVAAEAQQRPGAGPRGERAERLDREQQQAERGERAERGWPRGERGDGAPMLQRLRAAMEELDLSDEQREQLREIFTSAGDQIRALREDPGFREQDPAERRQAMAPVMQEAREQAMEVLTEEQQETLREHRRRLGDAPPEGAPMLGRLRVALAELDLTDEQRAQIDALRADTARELRELGAGQREHMRQVMQDVRQQLEEILTPEQQQQLREAAAGPAGPRGRGRTEVEERGPRGLRLDEGGPRRGPTGPRHRGDGPPQRPRE